MRTDPKHAVLRTVLAGEVPDGADVGDGRVEVGIEEVVRQLQANCDQPQKPASETPVTATLL